MSKKNYTLGNSARWVVSSPSAQKALDKIKKKQERKRRYFESLKEKK